tara:strand:- start:53 stop:286 length:234 start_codon:yes stop_codon:yes gene_type:complete
VPIFFLEKRNKKRALPFHPKIGDLNFLNAEEKTPSPTASVPSCRLSAIASHDLTTVKEKIPAGFSQILFRFTPKNFL